MTLFLMGISHALTPEEYRLVSISNTTSKNAALFQAQSMYPTGKKPSAITTGDFNGDEKLDLAITNAANNTVSILLNNQ